MRRRQDLRLQAVLRAVILCKHLLDRPADIRCHQHCRVPEADPQHGAHIIDRHTPAVRLFRIPVVTVYCDPGAAQHQFVSVENLPVRNPFRGKFPDGSFLECVRRVGIVFTEGRIKDIRCQAAFQDRVIHRVDMVVVRVAVEDHVHV